MDNVAVEFLRILCGCKQKDIPQIAASRRRIAAESICVARWGSSVTTSSSVDTHFDFRDRSQFAANGDFQAEASCLTKGAIVLARVSEHYNLKRKQPSLDFVDVDISGGIRFFVDPRALRLLDTDWGRECVALSQHFFDFVMQAIRSGDSAKARELLKVLRAPNETHLGLSQAKARGRALGHESAGDVYEALSSSEAARTGMLEDLEDTFPPQGL